MGLRTRHGPRRVFFLCLAITCLLIQPGSSTLQFSEADYGDGRAAAQQAGLSEECSRPVDKAWIEKVRRIRWAAYSPQRQNAGEMTQVNAETVRRDLQVLRKAGFSGLITYGSGGFLGRQFIGLAESLGFRGIIMGLWSPYNNAEITNALDAADRPIVLGYSIGNEGLSEVRERYSLADLCSAIAVLREGTGKPVTTSEVIETYYSRSELLWVGDWIFAISHPYWHNTKYPLEAIRWEEEQYSKLAKRTDKFIFFKEVGLPSRGAYGLSEANQDLYYRGLEETHVEFAYFEAFDQPSKAHNSVEPYWGIFHSNLTPKLLGWNLMGYRVFSPRGDAPIQVMQCLESGAKDCKILTSSNALRVGRERGEREYRSLVSFDTTGLPDNAVIRSIKLKLRLADAVGPDSSNKQRGITVDICLPPHAPSGGQGSDCEHNAGMLSQTAGGWYVVEFSPGSFGSINLQGNTQLRVRMEQAGRSDAPRNYLIFESQGTSAPVLVVRYDVP